MERSRLTEQVLEHQKTGDGHGALMSEIVKEVLDHKECYGLGSREEACDVLASYYPRISSLVKRFSGESRSFEPFLYSSLKFYKKSLLCKEREESLREREVQTRDRDPGEDIERPRDRDDADQAPRPSDESILEALTLDSRNRVSRFSARKRLLYLGMKCAFSLSDRHFSALARLSGLPEDHLDQRISFLRSMAQPRIERREALSALRDKLFASICFYERKLHDELDEAKRGRYRSMLERFKSRLENCRERLSAVRVEPTNAEIALVLGLPKGTVDSGIYCFKHFNARLR